MIALVCPVCGGPLPASAASSPLATCAFCCTTLVRQAQVFAASDPTTTQPTPEQVARGREALSDAIRSGLATGDDPRTVLTHALAEHMGLGTEADVVANVAFGLADELRAATGADVRRDVTAICRLAEAYVRATDGLRASGTAALDVPFITATPQGPVHFTRTLTVADVQAFARGDAASSVAAGATRSAKKKWWWPF